MSAHWPIGPVQGMAAVEAAKARAMALLACITATGNFVSSDILGHIMVWAGWTVQEAHWYRQGFEAPLDPDAFETALLLAMGVL